MKLDRASGVLLPISALWGTDSIGGFGREACDFIDFLADCGFGWWQVLPFCMADEYHSPYKSFSAFGGNPYFVDLRQLQQDGYLCADELKAIKEKTPYSCEYEMLDNTRLDLLRLASSRVDQYTKQTIADFIASQPYIETFCHFMALRRLNGDTPWYEWRTEESEHAESVAYKAEYFAWAFIQYHFMKQWQTVHDYAAARGIKIMGDMPIYVAYDSCDVWSNRAIFDLDADGTPQHVAGCPPDYFSADGQLWGNPLYNWERMEQDGFTWWTGRMTHMLNLFDGVRIDHFRGFESYWSIPATAQSAREGVWVKGPGMQLVHRLKQAAADIETVTGRRALIVAEDLGESTPSLARFVQDSGFPGMRVIQFAFDGDPHNIHLPHNYTPNTVAYTGTHDNNTLLGYIWEADETTRRRTLRYCGFTAEDWNCPDSCRAIIRSLFASCAGLAMLPIQDLLGYGADTRMNVPGQPHGNWRYRVTKAQKDSIDRDFFRELNVLYGRI